MKTNKLIMIPYAEIEGARSGQNISMVSDRKAVYLKNCCVACISAKKHNDSDVALVTNILVPEPYKSLLNDNGVLIIQCDFDSFCFDKNCTWSLAFYKLCALRYVINNLRYDYYAYTDADVYFQGSIDPLWSEAKDYVMLYDIDEGLQMKDYRIFLDEVQNFLGERRNIVHYGGELFVATKENAKAFSDKCYEIYLEMNKRGITTTCGDEYIVGLAAYEMKSFVKNAGAYIFRYWTGKNFRLITTAHKCCAIPILHTPSEKNCGIVRIYDEYVSKGKRPAPKTLYRILQLSGKDWGGALKRKIRRVLRINKV